MIFDVCISSPIYLRSPLSVSPVRSPSTSKQATRNDAGARPHSRLQELVPALELLVLGARRVRALHHLQQLALQRARSPAAASAVVVPGIGGRGRKTDSSSARRSSSLMLPAWSSSCGDVAGSIGRGFYAALLDGWCALSCFGFMASDEVRGVSRPYHCATESSRRRSRRGSRGEDRRGSWTLFRGGNAPTFQKQPQARERS